jgi:hypothetical protein
LDSSGLGWGQWRDLVNVLMNLLVPQTWVISLIAEQLLASQEGLCSVELVGWLVAFLVGWLVGRLL